METLLAEKKLHIGNNWMLGIIDLIEPTEHDHLKRVTVEYPETYRDVTGIVTGGKKVRYFVRYV